MFIKTNKKYLLVDIPGTYSIMSNSEEEEIARDYICFDNPDVTVVIVDATCLERNLNLVYQIMEITPNIIVCVNLLDEAKKKGIDINLKKLEEKLGVPVVGTIAKKKKTLKNLMDRIEIVASKKKENLPNKIQYIPVIEQILTNIISLVETILPMKKQYLSRWVSLKLLDGEKSILKSIEKNLEIDLLNNENLKKIISESYELLSIDNIERDNIRDKIVTSIVFQAENVCKEVVTYKKIEYQERDRKIDKILTSKLFSIPIMIFFLGLILWITIVGANYPSQWLSTLFSFIGDKLAFVFDLLHIPEWIKGILIDGMYKTLTWIIAVMLPPMAIFFPMFTLLEDLGYLPRIAFNLDKCFKRACSSRKTSINNVYGTWM